jgi:hypothetical protein
MDDPRLVPLARELDGFRVDKLASIRRFIDETLESPPERPTVAILLLPGVHRGTKHVWKHELETSGFDVVIGHPGELRYEIDGVRLHGRRIDAIWSDWFLYLGFQQTRYEQTRFESRVGNFSTSGMTATTLLEQLGLMAALVDRKVTVLSPIRGYRALSKALLAWVERKELAISDEDRAYVRDHLAETWDSARRRGDLSRQDARTQKDTLVLKPCRFGGSHGVVIGKECVADEWARRMDEIWTDPEWVLQRLVEPNLDERGQRLSYGVYNYAGTLGGLLVRAAPSMIVSARSASIIPTFTR